MRKLLAATAFVVGVTVLTPAQAASGLIFGSLTTEPMVTMVQVPPRPIKRPPPPAAPPGTVFKGPVTNPAAQGGVRDHRGQKPAMTSEQARAILRNREVQKLQYRCSISREACGGVVRDHRWKPSPPAPEDRHR